ncbi:AAA family ATPase [uncultured Psychromonas sp.]|uniref:ATP-dependent nuclease n=1 Tax=uncultured Psychromonas sp. TaxID=173974 RepID=UPI00260F4630|nr:AAA family ATPase [uncultured Psychromonas sp.]
MRLKSLYINEYKNLKNLNLTLTDNFLEVFVGKNGSGKSNLFEALIEIFRHIYESEIKYRDSNRKEIIPAPFKYKVEYEIDKSTVSIEYIGELLTTNYVIPPESDYIPFPEHILMYYSGKNNNIVKILEKYESRFRRAIGNEDDNDSSRIFIGIGSEYKHLLLATMLVLPEENKARQFIFDKLGLATQQTSIQLTLTRPSKTYAKGAQIDDFDPRTHYWGLKGRSLEFVKRLEKCIKGEFQHREIYFRTPQQYVLNIDIELFRNEFENDDAGRLFSYFDNLKALDMLADIKADITLTCGTQASLDFFSDGQIQSVYIYGISEIFKNYNCLTLLDEPDSFLHPEWQFEFLSQVNEISDTALKTNQVLMTSHSAVTLIPHETKKIRYMELKNENSLCFELPKHVVVQRLSSNLISYSEHENLLSIIQTIQTTNKPILFTEGSSDPYIINEAWRKLYQDEMPFIPYYAFSCTYINQLITDNRIHGEMQGKPIFSLFDFDKAFNQWNSLNGYTLESDVNKGLIKKWAEGNSFAIMLPVPVNPDIRSLVIKDEEKGTTWGGESSCAIEHLFYGLDATNQYFKIERSRGDGQNIAFNYDKIKFAKNIVPQLGPECFEVFRPMFDFIKQQCAQ